MKKIKYRRPRLHKLDKNKDLACAIGSAATGARLLAGSCSNGATAASLIMCQNGPLADVSNSVGCLSGSGNGDPGFYNGCTTGTDYSLATEQCQMGPGASANHGCDPGNGPVGA